MKKVKIGILGSRNLACIITEWISTQKNVEIIGIVPPPFKGWWNDNLWEVAKKNNLIIYENIEKLIDNNPDIVFSINYWKKIEKKIIDQVPLGIINIHHSYLLKYKGRYSTSWAIINARKMNVWEHGTTLHYIDENLDEGEIIASYKCNINETDTAETLFNKVESLAFSMFKDYFQQIIHNKITHFLEAEKNSYYYDINSNKDLEIKYGLPIEDVYDFIRAWSYKDRPKPYFRYKNKKIYLLLEKDESN